MLETMEEYDARRAAAVQAYGGRVEKPETPGQYAARRLRNEREKAARLAKTAAYAAACEGPLPGRDFSEVQNGDVLSGCEFVSGSATTRPTGGSGKAAAERRTWPAAAAAAVLVDEQQQHPERAAQGVVRCGARRQRQDGLPVAVQAMVQLWREDPAEVAYFLNDKPGRKQRLYVVDAQHASGRLVVLLAAARPSKRAAGVGAPRRRCPRVLLEDLAVGQALRPRSWASPARGLAVGDAPGAAARPRPPSGSRSRK